MPQQDPMKQYQDPYYRSLRRPRSNFGEKDFSQLAPMEEVLDNMAKAALIKRQSEIDQRMNELEQVYIDQRLSRLQNTFADPRKSYDAGAINRELDNATLELLRHGGTKTRQTASDIQKLRKSDKPDLQMTADEALIRGHITMEQYREMQKAKRAEAKRGSEFLRSEKVSENGVTKYVDYYGYKDDKGREVVTEKKYSDFTPSKGSGTGGGTRSNALKALEAKKNALQRRLYHLTQKGVDLDEIILTGPEFGDIEGLPVVKTRDGKEIEITQQDARDIRAWLDAVNAYEERATVEEQPVISSTEIAAKRKMDGERGKKSSKGQRGTGF